MSTRLTSELSDTSSIWAAVMSMALCVAVLIASEFMSVSLLTLTAAELGVSEGQAGHAIAIARLFAVTNSLTIAALNAGDAMAATISAPLGASRDAFALIVPVTVLALVWQRIHMPSRPPRGIRRTNPFGLLSRPQVSLGQASIFLLFAGHFALFTYLRADLEGVAGFSVPTLSGGFLALGLAGLTGTWAISRLLRTRLYDLLIAIPAVMAALAVPMIVLAEVPAGVDALQVAVTQRATMSDAAAGGLLFDALGWQATFALFAAVLCSSALCALLAWLHLRSLQ